MIEVWALPPRHECEEARSSEIRKERGTELDERRMSPLYKYHHDFEKESGETDAQTVYTSIQTVAVASILKAREEDTT